MQIHLSSSLAAALLVAASAGAQSAKFTEFGSGCPGSVPGAKVVASSNSSLNTLQGLMFAQTSEIAIEVTGMASAPLVSGFEILTKARSDGTKVQGHFYFADAQGVPLTTPAATGTMTVDSKADWYRMRLAQPLLVKPGSKLFVSWTDPRVPFSQIIDWPVPQGPVQGPSTSFHRYANSGSWGTGSSTRSWAYRVLSPSGLVAPDISASSLPQLGTNVDIELHEAKASSAAALIYGASSSQWGPVPLPFSLQPLGAPQCSLLVSVDGLSPQPTDAIGFAKVMLPIPSDKRFAGVQLQLQWMVIDPTANQLGLAFSEAATLQLGF